MLLDVDDERRAGRADAARQHPPATLDVPYFDHAPAGEPRQLGGDQHQRVVRGSHDDQFELVTHVLRVQMTNHPADAGIRVRRDEEDRQPRTARRAHRKASASAGFKHLTCGRVSG
jgi:hypothetical protein